MSLNLPMLNEGSTAARTIFPPRDPANENQEPAPQASQSFPLDLLCYLILCLFLATAAMMFALICIPLYTQLIASTIFILTGCNNTTVFHYAKPMFDSPATTLLNAIWHAILVTAFLDLRRRLQIKARFERARETEARLGIQIVRHWNPEMGRIRLRGVIGSSLTCVFLLRRLEGGLRVCGLRLSLWYGCEGRSMECWERDAVEGETVAEHSLYLIDLRVS